MGGRGARFAAGVLAAAWACWPAAAALFVGALFDANMANLFGVPTLGR